MQVTSTILTALLLAVQTAGSVNAPECDPSGATNGGCSFNCNCVAAKGAGKFYCASYYDNACQTDSVCDEGEFCGWYKRSNLCFNGEACTIVV